MIYPNFLEVAEANVYANMVPNPAIKVFKIYDVGVENVSPNKALLCLNKNGANLVLDNLKENEKYRLESGIKSGLLRFVSTN